MTDPATTIRAALEESGTEYDQPDEHTFVVSLPGERKLKTACALVVGAHSASVNAFVARNPDENHAEVYRWLLERNARMYGVSFAVDHHGDIYLTGRVALHSITADEVDRVLGAVLEYSDSAFNTILELGFASAIRKEYAWRTSRGESTINLAAFRHLTGEPDPGTPSSSDQTGAP